jgi:hypothetical protein
MGARARFAALLAVGLVIGVSGAAWGSDGDPMILGRTNTAGAVTFLNAGFAADRLQSTGDVLAAGWVSAGAGLTLEKHAHVIGQVRIPAERRCAVGPTPARNPTDDQSTSMIFTSVVGCPRGVYVAGSAIVFGEGLKVCLNRDTNRTVKVNWIDVDMDTTN